MYANTSPPLLPSLALPTSRQSQPVKGSAKTRVLMVCLGNICRSPTAHAVLEKYILDNGLQEFIYVDSAGTSDYHLGSRPDSRSIAVAEARGYSLQHQRARQVSSDDFQHFDYIIAMDEDNMQQLRSIAPTASRARLQLLLDYSEAAEKSVPDPYLRGEEAGFVHVLGLVEGACSNLLKHLEQHLIDSRKES